ncbi:alpha-L-rhamnosidase [Actinacidiphila yanglinensis]|uniref:Alpha-L-rhamnosidase n=1 Tax=Actinacidiphila yanglinensis TaxID=310779 RepID=A0A1H5TZ50_9ACTN|nr:alpha-L-rhamnosidase C-terminal domain-containing protein [Actinacidiphila yanglinensis]SEF68124.1 alpha-L-rhamnosidase [Actinacidiphila yanglinensis]
MSNSTEPGAGPKRRAFLRAGAATVVAAAAMRGVTAEAATPEGAVPEAAPGAAPAAAASAAAAGGKASAGRAAPSGPWDAFKLSPASRTVTPVAVHATTGSVANSGDLVRKSGSAATRLSEAGSSVTLDFGQETGGYVTLTFGDTSDADQRVGLTYSELSTYVSTTSSDGSNGGSNNEPPVCYTAEPAGRISTQTSVPVSGTDAADNPATQLRGGFRYLTVVNQTAGAVLLTGVSVEVTFAPNAADLRAYPNYFSCDDDLLTRIWYAGAYTVQTNIVANNQGRVWGPPALGWNNGARIGEAGDTVLVDGAKRDRTVWPGDLGISVLTDYVSLGDMRTVRDSLQTLYNHQAGNGALPYAGPAVDFIGNSDAYHLWTLIGTASYLQFTGDTGWSTAIYPKYKAALDYITAKIGTDGLLNVTQSADWARGDSDGKNIEANAIMYRALTSAGAFARSAGDTAAAADSAAKAAALKSAVEAGGYWDAGAGLYRDKPGNSLYPQDGNALAVWFGLVPDADRASAVSQALGERWTAVGALTPEKSATSVHPFPGGMEVHAHFAAGRDGTALDLIRREWGYMLNAPQGTASTFWEGYRTDGSSDYSGSYMSAAHGWSTGPTSALTFRLLGIAPDDEGGTGGYRVAPHPGGVGRAEGQLSTPGGVIGVSWQDRGRGGFDLKVTAPAGAVGEIAVPVPTGGSYAVRVDGALAWDGSPRAYAARQDGGYVRLTGVPAGSRSITVRRG